MIDVRTNQRLLQIESKTGGGRQKGDQPCVLRGSALGERTRESFLHPVDALVLVELLVV